MHDNTEALFGSGASGRYAANAPRGPPQGRTRNMWLLASGVSGFGACPRFVPHPPRCLRIRPRRRRAKVPKIQPCRKWVSPACSRSESQPRRKGNPKRVTHNGPWYNLCRRLCLQAAILRRLPRSTEAARALLSVECVEPVKIVLATCQRRTIIGRPAAKLRFRGCPRFVLPPILPILQNHRPNLPDLPDLPKRALAKPAPRGAAQSIASRPKTGFRKEARL